MKRLGRPVAAACSITDSDEVLVAKTAPSFATPSTSRHIVMQRPEKRNALHEELVRGLGEAFEAAAADTAVRCVVVRGAGPMFSSGMDLADLRTLSERPDQLRQFRSGILRVWNLLEEMPKPTICQIHGACIGGAMELALAADLRVMAEDAVAGLLETRIGLLPDVGGCSRLPAVVGQEADP